MILLVRIVGLRSFSKMTSFDFIMTIAMGSLVGSAARGEEFPAFVQACAAMGGLFLIQFAIASVRKRWSRFGDAIQNQPLLLMKDGQVIDRALETSRVARGDLLAKLREANVLDMSQVRAAILETTGDVSVLHGDRLESTLLEGVRRDGA